MQRRELLKCNAATARAAPFERAARAALFPEAGFDIVHDTSDPLGTQDCAPVMKAAKAADPDAFIAWSRPTNSFGLAEQAKIERLGVQGVPQRRGPLVQREDRLGMRANEPRQDPTSGRY